MNKIIKYDDFLEIDIRVGTVIKVEINTALKKPSMILLIDFGKKIGVKKSSAQITTNYNVKDILYKQVVGVVNFKPKQISKLISEVLVLGFPDNDGEPILISPDKKVKNGERLY